jgi:hypothetical protein
VDNKCVDGGDTTSTSSGSGSEELLLLDDNAMALNELGVEAGARVLLEVRNVDLTWPEEVAHLGGSYKLLNMAQGNVRARAQTLTNR